MLRCCIILLLVCIDSVQQKTMVLNTCIYCTVLTALVLITQHYSFQRVRYYKFSDFHSKCYYNDGLWIFALCSRNTRRPELKAEIAAVMKGISTETLAYMPSPKKFKFSASIFVMTCFTVTAVSASFLQPVREWHLLIMN